MDIGSYGVGVLTSVINAYSKPIEPTAGGGSSVPDLAVGIKDINIRVDQRHLLGYPGTGNCFFNAYDPRGYWCSVYGVYLGRCQLMTRGPNFAQNAAIVSHKKTGMVTVMKRQPY